MILDAYPQQRPLVVTNSKHSTIVSLHALCCPENITEVFVKCHKNFTEMQNKNTISAL